MKFILSFVKVFSIHAFGKDFEYLCKGAFNPDIGNTSVYLLKTNSNNQSALISGSKNIQLLLFS